MKNKIIIILRWVKNFEIFGKRELQFAEVMKVKRHTELWDAELAWYSPTSTHGICLYDLGHGLRIMVTWSCLIIDVLATLWNLLNHLITVLSSTAPSHLVQQIFWAGSAGVLWPSITESYDAKWSSVQLSNHTSCEAKYVSIYQLQFVATMSWNVSVTWYTLCKLARTKKL